MIDTQALELVVLRRISELIGDKAKSIDFYTQKTREGKVRIPLVFKKNYIISVSNEEEIDAKFIELLDNVLHSITKDIDEMKTRLSRG